MGNKLLKRGPRGGVGIKPGALWGLGLKSGKQALTKKVLSEGLEGKNANID
jgi:hypothetical protein